MANPTRPRNHRRKKDAGDLTYIHMVIMVPGFRDAGEGCRRNVIIHVASRQLITLSRLSQATIDVKSQII